MAISKLTKKSFTCNSNFVFSYLKKQNVSKKNFTTLSNNINKINISSNKLPELSIFDKINYAKRYNSTTNKQTIIIEVPTFNNVVSNLFTFIKGSKFVIDDKFRKQFNDYHKNVDSFLDKDEKKFMTEFEQHFLGNYFTGNVYLYKNNFLTEMYHHAFKSALVVSLVPKIIEQITYCSHHDMTFLYCISGFVWIINMAVKFGYAVDTKQFHNNTSKYASLKQIIEKHKKDVTTNIDNLD